MAWQGVEGFGVQGFKVQGPRETRVLLVEEPRSQISQEPWEEGVRGTFRPNVTEFEI